MNFQFFKMILVLLFMQAVTMVNVNSHSGIYDLSGNCKQEIYSISYLEYLEPKFLVRCPHERLVVFVRGGLLQYYAVCLFLKIIF